MAARSEAEVISLLVYKSPAWKGGVLYFNQSHILASLASACVTSTIAPRPSFYRWFVCA